MRTIKIRGKSKFTDHRWVEGGFTFDAIGKPRISTLDASKEGLIFHKVIPETIGQFTGLIDKNGKEIFEGDIVSAWSDGYNHKGEVRWRFGGQPSIIIYPAFGNQGFWKLHGEGAGDAFSDGKIDDGVEIIGNIHDNPELLK